MDLQVVLLVIMVQVMDHPCIMDLLALTMAHPVLVDLVHIMAPLAILAPLQMVMDTGDPQVQAMDPLDQSHIMVQDPEVPLNHK